MGTRFKYFPLDNGTKHWGLSLCDVGWQQSSLGEEYPTRLHPDGYFYTWEAGRRLSEYQLCLVFSGKGIVEFERGKPVPLESGTLLLVAPGQWHRCRPDSDMGWGTLWIGFKGKSASAIVRSIFKADGCTVRPIAKAKDFKYAAMRFIARVFKHGESKPCSTIGELTSLLGRIADGEFDGKAASSGASAIRAAQLEIAKRYAEYIDFKALALSLGLSYDAFRHRFAAETGLSPLQFQLAERLRVAKNLITNSGMPILEIAKSTGFATSAYFARFFSKATSMSPIAYRKAQSTI